MKVQKPLLDPESVHQMHQLWLAAFGNDFVSDVPDDLLYGEQNHCLPTYIRGADDIYGHCNQPLGSPVSWRSWGGLHSPPVPGEGLATRICQQLVKDFQRAEGLALFLGTVNPEAARIYERLGWQHINGSKLMVNLSGSDDYDDFIHRYFATSTPSQICRAKPASRIPIIPLVIFPHAWSILDSNISLYSTNVEPQLSCLGLYRRYDYLRTRGQGEWFTLITEEAKS